MRNISTLFVLVRLVCMKGNQIAGYHFLSFSAKDSHANIVQYFWRRNFIKQVKEILSHVLKGTDVIGNSNNCRQRKLHSTKGFG